MVKAETLVVGNKVKKVGGEKQAAAKKENKYEKLVNKKRKLNDTENKENSSETSIKAKKPRVDEMQKKPLKKKQNETDGKVKKEKNGEKKKATFSPAAAGKKLAVKKNGTGGKKTELNTQPLSKKEQKDLKIKRKQKKLADNYSLSINIKKIWETLRKSETTEETRQKLCSSVYEQVKGKINQLAFAHDTCRVIECLIQYGNDKHRIGIFDELKMDIVKMAKCKYARFVLKKMLSYGSKEQKNAIIKSFSGKVTKLIKHSYACQLVEAIFNEHASFSQRNHMLMEFYDPTLAILVDQSNTKSLADILATNEVSKEKIMANLKGILSSCIDKTLLMFSIIHRVFLEYLNNCSAEERSDMIEVLSEQLVHMVHTRDGAQVAMECIWHSTAKQRKKIIKGMKSFITKVALEEQGHLVLLAIFDSVDDTKLVQKGILEEMFRSIGDLFGNEYGRKVITYLVVARDTRFFLKDYSKRLEKGDSSETSKKDPEKRRAELFEYSSPFLVDYIRKELKSLLYNGAVGILVPSILQRLGSKANELIQAIANLILESPYEPEKPATATVKLHLIEDATSHFVIRKILQINKDAKQDEKSLSLSHALLSHSNVKNILSWIDCNRGCFILVNLIETSDESDKKRAISLIKEVAKDLDLTKPGAKLLNEKLK